MLPPLRFYSSVSNVDASPDALASGFELFACSTFLLERFAFDHACCLTHSAKQNGLRNVSFLFRRGSGSPIVRSQRPCDYRTQLVQFGIVRFLAAIPTVNEETRDRGRPEN